MKTRPDIRFFFRLSKGATLAERTAESPGTVYCSLTVKGQQKVFSTLVPTNYGQWDARSYRLLGKSTLVKQANETLAQITTDLHDLAADLDRQKKPVTAQTIMQLYRSEGCSISLLQLFKDFNAERKNLIGIEVSETTVRKSKVRHNRLREFLAAHKLSDLRPEEFSPNLADKLLYWLMQDRGLQRNSANNILKGVKQALTWGVRREQIQENPLKLYQLKSTVPNPIKFLTEAELAHLTTAPLAVPCLVRVRDCFVFQCWTGLAYADLAALDLATAEYQRDAQGTLRRVVRIRRAKSTLFQGYECVIPLLPEAERILALYADRLPVLANQVYNRYLKQIGELCGLDESKMTTHVGRKTAGTLLLNRGVPLPVVSKFLGHANTAITEKLYAKLLDTTVMDAFGAAFGVAPAIPLPSLSGAVLELSEVAQPKRPARRIASAVVEAQNSLVVAMWKGGEAA